MTMNMEMPDARAAVIQRMNVGRVQQNKPPLNPRQEHLVREFFDDEGNIAEADKPLLMQLLQSNSV